MSEHESDAVALARLKYADAQAARDWWWRLLLGLSLGVAPLVSVLTSYVEHRYTADVINKAKVEVNSNVAAVEEKADKAAVKATAAAIKADAADKTATSTNVITTKWWADRTGAPEDIVVAAKAQEKQEEIMGVGSKAPPE